MKQQSNLVTAIGCGLALLWMTVYIAAIGTAIWLLVHFARKWW